MIKFRYRPTVRHMISLLAGSLLVASMGTSQAASTTFAQFFQQLNDKPFLWTGVAPPGTSTLTPSATYKGTGIPVDFKFLDFFGGPLMGTPVLNFGYKAHVSVDVKTTNPMSGNDTPLDFEKLVFTADSDAVNIAAGIAGKNLLTTFGSLAALAGDLKGDEGDSSPTLKVSEPTNVLTFTSDIINLAGVTEENYSLSFSGADPPVHYLGAFPFQYAQTMKLDASGTFAATPTIPEPGTITLVASLALTGTALRFRRRRA